jgi:hypothetical protein
MKKRKRKLKKSFSIEKDIIWGLKGLQISFTALILLSIIMLLLFFLIKQSGLGIMQDLLRKPQGIDYNVIFAGFLLFIAVPFLIGIKIGIYLKRY